MSNNPPDVSLEFTAEEAQFLMANCNSNIQFGLSALQNGGFSRETMEKIVAVMEGFKPIREKLIRQGVDGGI